MKNLLNVNGAQQLSKNEQQSINGGKTPNWCESQDNYTQCGGTPNYVCCNGQCVDLQGQQCPG